MPTVGEHLIEWEMGNTENPYTVAVLHRSTDVGHVLRRMSAACAVFLDREGPISCTATAISRFSADFPQGGTALHLLVPGTSKACGQDEEACSSRCKEAIEH